LSKSIRKALVKKLDTVHSQYIRLRDGACVICNNKERLQCGHLFTRAAYSTRWDLDLEGNCHANCAPCNIRHEYDPYMFNEWYIRKFGKGRWDDLHRRHKKTFIIKNHELEELYRIICSCLKALQETQEDLF
jgi:hypothetical protein